MPHHYDPPVAFPRHNTPCKACGKTARHSVHKLVAAWPFDASYLSEPADATDQWRFHEDLRGYFPPQEYGNNDIGRILEARGVLAPETADTEYSCTYAGFATQAEGEAFLARLNALILEARK